MSRTFSKLVLTAGVAASFLFVSSNNANAASFTSVASTDDTPGGDFLLDSVVLQGGTIIDSSEILYAKDVTIVSNDPFDPLVENSGAASADIGITATPGVVAEDPSDADLLANLGNNNLNNIVDTEETGSFVIDVDFDETIKSLFVWERGGNSTIGLQALDAGGNPIGTAQELFSGDWDYAGFDIETTEIDEFGPQAVNSAVFKVSNLFGTSEDISKIRVFSNGPAFNGPDWKIAGTSVAVPEPATILGLTALAGAFVATRRRQADA